MRERRNKRGSRKGTSSIGGRERKKEEERRHEVGEGRGERHTRVLTMSCLSLSAVEEGLTASKGEICQS